jgi:hypothetical protein
MMNFMFPRRSPLAESGAIIPGFILAGLPIMVRRCLTHHTAPKVLLHVAATVRRSDG